MLISTRNIYILIVNYHSFSLITRLINSFTLSTLPCQVVIVNNSPEEEVRLKELNHPFVEIIEAGINLGFGCACNLGLKKIYHFDSEALVWLMNPDVVIDPKMLARVPDCFEEYPSLSILGTLIYDTDDQVWFGGGTFNSMKGEILSEDLFHPHSQNSYIFCNWVSGCSLIINFRHFLACPQFDSNYFLYYEDFDFCQRYQRQGHLVAVTNKIHIIHQVSEITNRNPRMKFYYSTYSYLLTLQRYSNKLIFSLRLIRLLIMAVILFPVNRPIALGKIGGAWHFLKKHFYGFFLGHF